MQMMKKKKGFLNGRSKEIFRVRKCDIIQLDTKYKEVKFCLANELEKLRNLAITLHKYVFI